MVTVTGRWTAADDTPMSGLIAFTPNVALTNADEQQIILPSPVVAHLDETGAISVDLIATDDADYTPSGWVWQVSERLKQGERTYLIELPSSPDPVDLSTLVPVLDAPPVSAYDAAGTAAAAVTAHDAATDPHGDRAYADNLAGGKASATRQITAGSGLTGGGDLTADRTLAASYGSPTAQTAFGGSSAAGSASTLARSDHTHGTPAYPDARYLMQVDAPTGVLAAPRYKLILDHDPAVAEPNTFEIWSTVGTGPAVQVLCGWFNERGMLRIEQPHSSALWDVPLKAIMSYLNDSAGSPVLSFQVEVRNADNSRTVRGGLDRFGRPATSMQAWSAPTAIDPGTTGKYAQATADGFGGTNNVAALGVRWIGDDLAQMRGGVVVTGSSAPGDVMFVLPSGFAPTKVQSLSCAYSGGGSSIAQISTSGQVICRRTNSGGTWFFDGLIYQR